MISAPADFVIAGLNSSAPGYYWRGKPLGEVLGIVAHVDDDSEHIRIRVLDTTNFDSDYLEMTGAGISVKKVSQP
jgi:hypothetical protein